MLAPSMHAAISSLEDIGREPLLSHVQVSIWTTVGAAAAPSYHHHLDRLFTCATLSGHAFQAFRMGSWLLLSLWWKLVSAIEVSRTLL